MFLTERKYESRIRELSGFRYRDAVTIPEFLVQEDDGEIGTYPPSSYNPKQTMKLGDYWKGRDKYLWLHAVVEDLEAFQGKQMVGLFSFGRTGGGNNSGFESLLFVNGHPYQGVDSNHEEVLFDDELQKAPLRLDFRLWSGLEGGGGPREQEYKLRQAQIAWLDTKMDNLYYTLYAAFEVLKETSENDPAYYTLNQLIGDALRKIDWTAPGSEAFYQSCYEAEEELMAALDQIEKHSEVTVHTVGHTHIDVAWLWRLKHTREKSARSFSTVLNLMKRFPDYLFLQTQPQLYDYIKEDYPEIYEKMKVKIKEGQWEAAGAMWLEADCNIPSGESLVRQILYGKEFFQKEFGTDSKYLWLPDVFGYSWALPQILVKSGIKTMMTTKISWNQYNRMPHDTFYWKGIDGTEILTHFITTPEPWNPPESWFYTYNGLITAKTVKGVWNSYRNKEISKDVLLSYGYGDGGGGVNRHMLEMRRRLDKLPGVPNVKPSTAGDFFEKLHENVEKAKEAKSYIHKWDGELYLEYHRGTYTSQAYVKKMNRKLELQYRRAEILTSWLNGNGYPDLFEGWKIILRNQFHDIIPGSSITEVYEDAKVEYGEAQEIVNKVEDKLLTNKVESDEQTVTLINASHLQDVRNVWIGEHADKDGVWKTADGNELKAQKYAGGWLVEVDEVPAFGAKQLVFEEAEAASANSNFHYADRKLETPYYSVVFNEYGQIERLYDKEADREVLADGENGNVLQIFEDRPLAHDAWDIDLFYQEKMEEIRNLTAFDVVENGELAFVIRAEWKYHKSAIKQDIVFYANNRRIDFKTEVDWHEKRKLLKAAFPVNVRSTYATYDIQFGNVQRPNHWNTSWDWARFETVGHQWADLSETGYGVSLLNDCKYGYDIKEHLMRLSLLKAPVYPDPEADMGVHNFTYALYPHIGDWREAKTVETAWDLNDPLMVVNGKWNGEESFLTVKSNHIWVDAIKPAQDGDGYIVRVHEFHGRRGPVEIEFHKPVQTWVETDLMEQAIGEEQAGNVLTFDIKPYEIKTFRIK